MSIFKAVSFPDGTLFASNTITIDTPIYDISDNQQSYDHLGTYIVSSSSYFDDTTDAYHAFNNTAATYWKTNTTENSYIFPDNTKPYVQTPYLVSDNGINASTYQGGGSLNDNYFTTNIQTPHNTPKHVSGEWLQIQLPVPFKLIQYNLLTPPAPNSKSYLPMDFTVAGSDDGITWRFVHQTTNNDANKLPKDPVDGSTIFYINSSSNRTAYTYYRLIVTKMPPGSSVVRISKWNLLGVPEPPEKEGFTGLNNRLNYFNFSPGLNAYSNFAISRPIIEGHTGGHGHSGCHSHGGHGHGHGHIGGHHNYYGHYDSGSTNGSYWPDYYHYYAPVLGETAILVDDTIREDDGPSVLEAVLPATIFLLIAGAGLLLWQSAASRRP